MMKELLTKQIFGI